jgi:hypothetical protein
VSFLVEVEHRFRAVQGLPSPVRAQHGLALLPAGSAVDLVITAGVEFEEDQLTERGWFFDTDAAAIVLRQRCAALQSRPWTELFDFRPTFELVARHLHRELATDLPQLSFLKIRDETFGVTTGYSSRPAPGRSGEGRRDRRGRQAAQGAGLAEEVALPQQAAQLGQGDGA